MPTTTLTLQQPYVRYHDLTGRKFTRLQVIRRNGQVGEKCLRTAWLCKCECGTECTVSSTNLRRGLTKSCGCLKKDALAAMNAPRKRTSEQKKAAATIRKTKWMNTWRLINVYNITPDDHKRLFDAQNGKCVLPSCGKQANATDHDHITGKTRGLMCKEHNSALGLFSDNPGLLREAADYLERSK
jgi:hypothetical protein